MFRISRIRVRWIDSDQANLAGMLASGRALGLDLARLAPWNWRIQVKWLGFGRMQGELPKSVAMPGRVLRTFDFPNMKVQVSWTVTGSTSFTRLGILGVLVACLWLGFFVVPRLAAGNLRNANPALSTERINREGLVSLEVNLGGQTMQMTHSPLDIGQVPDVFDHNLETLIRGREDNPFVLDFDFSEPRAINGLTMDFGRMDFVLRVQVYGTGEAEPVSYESDYREQPAIPHVDMDFSNGPAQVRRIYIEIEQLDPPQEVHIHIREVVLKE